jgi:phage-related protein
MPVVGSRCHELRIPDEKQTWRVIYSVESDAIVILEVFSKKTKTTPKAVIQTCQRRLRMYREL